MDINTLILMVHVNVGNAPAEDIPELLSIVAQQVRKPEDENDNVRFYFLPVREAVIPAIQCINPKMITGEEFKTIQKRLDNTNKKINKILKEKNATT
jgi:hypothetical protein